jgi:hypothetical protein
MGVLFSWMRFATGSIWPAVVGHGALDAAGGFSYVFANTEQALDTAYVTILDWRGWILSTQAICLFVVLKRLTVFPPR